MKAIFLSCLMITVVLAPFTIFMSPIFLFTQNIAFGAWIIVPFGEVSVKLYIVALNGVDGQGVNDINSTVNGVLLTARVNTTDCTIEYVPPRWLGSSKVGEVHVNTSVTVIRDWETYKQTVEGCSNAIIVNAHAETVPIPSGYSKENWIDRIAEALAYRNVTWVHTGGYPFYYYRHQEGGEGTWGEEGFQRLMSHIGKSNVTCWPPDYETRKISLSSDAKYTVMKAGWYGLYDAYWAERGRPLKGSDFKNYTVLPIWGTRDGWMTGAIIKFAKLNQTQGLGFYVHVGAGQTYKSDGEIKTDRDFYRGYVGAAAAIWTCAWRSATEDAIVQAEGAIAKAEDDGRTKGLDDARTFLQNAKNLLEAIFRNDKNETNRLIELYPLIKTHTGFGTVILRASRARDTADKAVNPSFIEAYTLPLTIIGVISVAATTGLAIRWKKNSRRKRTTRNEKS